MSFFRFNRANQLVQIKCSKLFEKFLKWVSFEGFFFLILKMKQQQHDINLRRTRKKKKIRVPDGI